MAGAYVSKPPLVVALDIPAGWNIYWPFLMDVTAETLASATVSSTYEVAPHPPGYEPSYSLAGDVE
jgi:hypothetical protein